MRLPFKAWFKRNKERLTEPVSIRSRNGNFQSRKRFCSRYERTPDSVQAPLPLPCVKPLPMSFKYLGLIVGGLLPALLLGFAGVFQKLATNHPLGTGPFLMLTGLTTCLIGGLYSLLDRDWEISRNGALMTFVFSLFWSTSTGLILIAMRKFGASISQLAPLYNLNTLVAVLAGLLLLAEWRSVHPTRILLASVLIICGGLLAVRS